MTDERSGADKPRFKLGGGFWKRLSGRNNTNDNDYASYEGGAESGAYPTGMDGLGALDEPIGAASQAIDAAVPNIEDVDSFDGSEPESGSGLGSDFRSEPGTQPESELSSELQPELPSESNSDLGSVERNPYEFGDPQANPYEYGDPYGFDDPYGFGGAEPNPYESEEGEPGSYEPGGYESEEDYLEEDYLEEGYLEEEPEGAEVAEGEGALEGDGESGIDVPEVFDYDPFDDGFEAVPESFGQGFVEPAMPSPYEPDAAGPYEPYEPDASNPYDIATPADIDATGQLVRIFEDGSASADAQGAGDGTPAADGTINVYSGAIEGLTTKGKRLRIIAVAASVVLALALVYALGVRRFSARFLPNTSIQGHDVSGLTMEEAESSLEGETTGYNCVIHVGDFETTVSGADLAVNRDEARIAVDARAKQSAYAWPIRLVSHQDINVDQNVTYNEQELTSLVVKAVEAYNEEALPTDNASITYNEESGTYALEGTVDGTALDANAVLAAASEDVRSFNKQSQPDESVALRPATVQDIPSYAHAVEWTNRARTTDVPILVNGEEVAVSDATQNAELVSIADGPVVVVDEDALRIWTEYTVADAVYHRDDWNDYYLDQDAFVSGFIARLSTGVVDGYEAPTYVERRREGISRDRAYENGGWNSELGRYIDVDLDAQFARLFDEKGDVLWESAVVSGNMYEAHSTVTGIFSIYTKQMGTVLVGFDYDQDGKPDYESYVNYWMPFYGGYGLHDATWRYNFGGDLYYYDGSHGCINLPYDKAEELFNITYVGEVVNVHW